MVQMGGVLKYKVLLFSQANQFSSSPTQELLGQEGQVLETGLNCPCCVQWYSMEQNFWAAEINQVMVFKLIYFDYVCTQG